jgi:hypothetical protein
LLELRGARQREGEKERKRDEWDVRKTMKKEKNNGGQRQVKTTSIHNNLDTKQK